MVSSNRAPVQNHKSGTFKFHLVLKSSVFHSVSATTCKLASHSCLLVAQILCTPSRLGKTPVSLLHIHACLLLKSSVLHVALKNACQLVLSSCLLGAQIILLYSALENVCQLASHSRLLRAQILCSLSRPVKRLSACFTLSFAWCSNPFYSTPPSKTPVTVLMKNGGGK